MPPMDDESYLVTHRRVWAEKPVLRRIYAEQFYAPLLAYRGARTLEIGSGPGLLSDIAPDVIRTDILPSPFIHLAADAHRLPFADGTFDSVIGLDVLHHFETPVRVLHEIARVLRPGGRLALVEPWITPFSRFVYTHLHQETCDLRVQPWLDTSQFAAGKHKAAFDGNAAIPYRLVQHPEALPEWQLERCEVFCLFTYLLSLGFKRGSLLPAAAYPFVYRMERMTAPLWRRPAALRALLVWRKPQ
jgi:SAM-dependent methyltransferase